MPEYLNKVLNKALYYNRTFLDSTLVEVVLTRIGSCALHNLIFFLFIDTS